MTFFVFVRVILCGFYFQFMRIYAVLCSFVWFCSDNVWTMFGQSFNPRGPALGLRCREFDFFVSLLIFVLLC